MTSVDHRLVVTAAAFDGAMCGCRLAPQDFQKEIDMNIFTTPNKF